VSICPTRTLLDAQIQVTQNAQFKRTKLINLAQIFNINYSHTHKNQNKLQFSQAARYFSEPC